MPVARPALAGGRADVSVTSLAKDRRFSRLTSNVQQRASNAQRPQRPQRPTPNAEWWTNDRRSIPPKLLSAEQSGFYLVGKLGGGDPGFYPTSGSNRWDGSEARAIGQDVRRRCDSSYGPLFTC